jgi:DNA-binding MarR family transcriptional regulator
VQHVVDLGLVERAPDPADGRASILAVTESGRRRFDEVTRARHRLLDERLGDWDDDELAHFAEQMVRYNASLEVGEPAASAEPGGGVRG